MTKTSNRNIDPNTLWDAKIYAAQTKQTMGEVITQAIERLIRYDNGDCEEEEYDNEYTA